MIVPALIFAGAIAVIYYLSQQDMADAPGHCGGCTVEQSRERLSFNALVSLAQDAGFDTDSQTAAAIALAESGGDPNAYNPETQAGAPEGKGSYGLWQIYLHAHPEYEGQDLTDPQTNAEAAYAIYSKAKGFSPWSTFKNGAYQKFVA
jgi:soluble lytic murein transglycosylase-like protein